MLWVPSGHGAGYAQVPFISSHFASRKPKVPACEMTFQVSSQEMTRRCGCESADRWAATRRCTTRRTTLPGPRCAAADHRLRPLSTRVVPQRARARADPSRACAGARGGAHGTAVPAAAALQPLHALPSRRGTVIAHTSRGVGTATDVRSAPMYTVSGGVLAKRRQRAGTCSKQERG